MTREELFAYAKATYGVEPDYPWMDLPEACVLRHKDSRKWFGLVMIISERHLGKSALQPSEGRPPEDRPIVALDVKADPAFISMSVGKGGFYRAYHMNKEHWVTLHLGEASDDAVKMALDESFVLTEGKKKK